MEVVTPNHAAVIRASLDSFLRETVVIVVIAGDATVARTTTQAHLDFAHAALEAADALVAERDAARGDARKLLLLYSLAIEYERAHGSHAQAERMITALSASGEEK